ncbi:MAG: CHRD domain-containing protein [Chloroflexota bacterium]
MKQHIVLRVVIVSAILAVLGAVALISLAQDDSAHQHTPVGEARPETERESSIPLNVGLASEIGAVYQAFPSPQQQSGEEEDTPNIAPQTFRSTAPSVDREDRDSRAHVVLEFTNDLSRAYLHVAIENINPEDIVMVHLHCGVPGHLGPLIGDFGMMGNVQEYFADGIFTIEITNADLEMVVDNALGLVGGFTGGCPVEVDGLAEQILVVPTDKIVTLAGMERMARQGELYFNLHTAGQTFFGDTRGAFYPVNNGQ